MFEIKVIDKNSKYFGETLKGSVCYYDIKHTGNSDDLYIAVTEDGEKVKLLSSQIDEEFYHEQELEQVTKEIGAKIGDKVIILKDGSGSYKKDWQQEGVHVVTKIDFTGHVTFDDGMATIFRPKLELVSE